MDLLRHELAPFMSVAHLNKKYRGISRNFPHLRSVRLRLNVSSFHLCIFFVICNWSKKLIKPFCNNTWLTLLKATIFLFKFSEISNVFPRVPCFPLGLISFRNGRLVAQSAWFETVLLSLSLSLFSVQATDNAL